MHPGAVRGVQRDIAHPQQRLAILRLGHRALRHAEMLWPELAGGFLNQQDLTVDGVAHGVSPLLVVASASEAIQRQQSKDSIASSQGLLAMTRSMGWSTGMPAKLVARTSKPATLAAAGKTPGVAKCQQ